MAMRGVRVEMGLGFRAGPDTKGRKRGGRGGRDGVMILRVRRDDMHILLRLVVFLFPPSFLHFVLLFLFLFVERSCEHGVYGIYHGDSELILELYERQRLA